MVSASLTISCITTRSPCSNSEAEEEEEEEAAEADAEADVEAEAEAEAGSAAGAGRAWAKAKFWNEFDCARRVGRPSPAEMARRRRCTSTGISAAGRMASTGAVPGCPPSPGSSPPPSSLPSSSLDSQWKGRIGGGGAYREESSKSPSMYK